MRLIKNPTPEQIKAARRHALDPGRFEHDLGLPNGNPNALRIGFDGKGKLTVYAPWLVSDPADARDAGAYVEIPAGPYKIGDKKRKFTLKEPFSIGRLPLTNAQYGLFIEQRAYKERRWWSDDGWKWLQREKVTACGWGSDPVFGFQDSLPHRLKVLAQLRRPLEHAIDPGGARFLTLSG